MCWEKYSTGLVNTELSLAQGPQKKNIIIKRTECKNSRTDVYVRQQHAGNKEKRIDP